MHILNYFPLFVALMSLATLFVYRPKKFKALPWIVLAIMGLSFFCMAMVQDNCFTALLYSYDGRFECNPGYSMHRFFWIGKADLRLVDYTKVYSVVCAVPILALWIMLIVGAVQKRKKTS